MRNAFLLIVLLFSGSLYIAQMNNIGNDYPQDLSNGQDEAYEIPFELVVDVLIAETVVRIKARKAKEDGPTEVYQQLSDEEMIEILNRYDCPLINRMGARGLELMRENFNKKTPSGYQYSSAADALCTNLVEDGGRFDKGKIKYIPQDALTPKELANNLYMACWPAKFQTMESRKKILAKKSYQADTIAPVLLKLFSKYLNCREGGPGHNKGHMFKSIFEQRLFFIADYLIEGIEKELGKEYTLTLEDISTPEDRYFIKEELCKTIPGDERFVEDKKRYLKKFYGITTCN